MWSIVNKETGHALRDKIDFTDVVCTGAGHPFHSKLDVVNFMNNTFLSAGVQAGAPTASVATSLSILSRAVHHNPWSIRLRPSHKMSSRR